MAGVAGWREAWNLAWGEVWPLIRPSVPVGQLQEVWSFDGTSITFSCEQCGMVVSGEGIGGASGKGSWW